MKRGVKMYYPDEVIDDIVSGNDIVDVIGFSCEYIFNYFDYGN